MEIHYFPIFWEPPGIVQIDRFLVGVENDFAADVLERNRQMEAGLTSSFTHLKFWNDNSWGTFYKATYNHLLDDSDAQDTLKLYTAEWTMQSGDAIMMIWVKLPNTNQPFSMHFRCTTGLKSKIQFNSKVDWILQIFFFGTYGTKVILWIFIFWVKNRVNWVTG